MRLKQYPFRLKRVYLIYLFLIGSTIYIFLPKEDSQIQKNNTTTPTNLLLSNSSKEAIKQKQLSDILNDAEVRNHIIQEKIKRLERRINKSRAIISNSKPMLKPNYNVHIFYYAWYKNPSVDGKYSHWNHKYLENWKRGDYGSYPSGMHLPPVDIGSNFYPQLGCYSSADVRVIETHFKWLKEAGVGVVVVSWVPLNFTDSPVGIMPLLFEIAPKYKLKISIHIEPYPGRNPINLIEYLKDFIRNYGDHPALYKIKKPMGQKMVPVIYIYDSYLIPSAAWKEIFSAKGNLSVRDSEIDAIYLGLLVDIDHKNHIKKSHFDGFYTYFATNGFTYGSTWKNWKFLSKFAVQNGLIFVPSVGPGYIDTRVRAWNEPNTRSRSHGQYYDVAWRSALSNNANYISITSFNEWHEGTQIEPAIPKTVTGFTYMDYQPEGPYFYLNLTKSWIEQFESSFG